MARPRPAPVVPLSEAEQAALLQVLTDPVLFCRAFLGFEPWSKQAEIMRAVAEHDRVAVASGHKIGKSLLAAAIALWFCVTKPKARVIMTAAIGRQVEKVLWREVKALYDQAESRMGAEGMPISTPLGGKLAMMPDSGLVFPDGREIFGFATDEKERMAGYSGENLLFIVDEASGVPEGIFEAIEGNRAGGAKVLMLSNPTQPSGTFYDAFHSKRSFYRTFQVSSEDTPNVTSGQRLVPGLATAEYIAEKREEWGPDYLNNPLYLVRILGKFATQAANALVSLTNLVNGIANFDLDPLTDAEAPLRCGLDVARYGDDACVLAPRRGRRKPHASKTLSKGDGAELAHHAVQQVQAWMTPDERLQPKQVVLFVDAIGVGWSPVDHLKRHPNRAFTLVPVVVSRQSNVMGENGHPKYANLRAQLWFEMAEWTNHCLLPDREGKLHEELIDVRYKINDKLQLQIESKDDIKKRLGRSCDEADALVLTFAPTGALAIRPVKAGLERALSQL